MKIILPLMLICTLLLVGCGVEFGANYQHLQEQDPTGLRRVNFEDGTNQNVDDIERERVGGVFEELNENLCDLSPECCGQFTDEQKDLRDLESQAVVERNIDLCYQLPEEPLIISCGNDFDEDVVLYSRQRCIDSFEE